MPLTRDGARRSESVFCLFVLLHYILLSTCHEPHSSGLEIRRRILFIPSSQCNIPFPSLSRTPGRQLSVPLEIARGIQSLLSACSPPIYLC